MIEICRTCLQEISGTSSVSVKDYAQSIDIKSKLAVCVPEVNLSLVANPVLCMPCADSVHSVYDFVSECQRNEDRVRSCLQTFSNKPVTLTDIYRKLHETNAELINNQVFQICRTCLKETIHTEGAACSTKIRTELAICIPEVSVQLIADPVLCATCVKHLHFAYNFIIGCQLNEDRIQNCVQTMKCNGQLVLADVYHKLNEYELTSYIKQNIANELSLSHADGVENVNEFWLHNDDIVKEEHHPIKVENESMPLWEVQNFGYNFCAGAITYQTDKGDNNKRNSEILQIPKYKAEKVKTENEITIVEEELHIRKGESCDFYYELDVQSSELEIRNENLQNCFVKLERLPDYLVRYKINSNEADFIFCHLCKYKTNKKYNLRVHISKYHRGKPQYICHDCGYISAYKQHLERHWKNVHSQERPEKKSFACDKCNFTSAEKHRFLRHVRHVHLKIKPFSCDMCNYHARYSYEVKRHKQVSHSNSLEKNFNCSICQYSTNYKTSFKNHLQVHFGEKPFACTLCDFSTARKPYLQAHMRIHTGEKPFKCEMCDYSAAHKQRLIEHIKKHNNEKPFVCEFCKSSFINKFDLKKHMRVHTGIKPFSCNVCEFKTATKFGLKAHITTHFNHKPLACTKCKYRCALKCQLKSHMRIHEDKKFTCDICYHTTSYKTDFQRHVMVHGGLKPFLCSMCDFRTAYKGSLRDHVKTHASTKPFACNKCSYSAANKRYLQRHMNSHEGKKVRGTKIFTCYICHMSTLWKGALIKHMQTHNI